MNKSTRKIVLAGLIAALYAALTIALAPISFANIQCRVSEALTVLPILIPEAIPGLTLGCLISNTWGLSSGVTMIWDVIFGTLATLLASVGSYLLRNKTVRIPVPVLEKSRIRVKRSQVPLLSALCPVVANAVIVGLVLSLSFNLPLLLTMLEVGIGEISAVLVGIVLLPLLQRALAGFMKGNH